MSRKFLLSVVALLITTFQPYAQVNENDLGPNDRIYLFQIKGSLSNNVGQFAWAPLDGPIIPLNILNQNNDYLIEAADFDDQNSLYGLEINQGNLLQLNTDNGDMNIVAPISGSVAGHTLYGLSFDHTSGTMYALSANTAGSQLYTINLTTGELIKVGPAMSGLQGVWLAIDNNGDGYMCDKKSKSTYKIDLSNGTPTLLGSLNFSSDLYKESHSASFDHATNTLQATFTLVKGFITTTFWDIDLVTGEATNNSGEFGHSNQYSFSAIQNGSPTGIPTALFADLTYSPNPVSEHLQIQLTQSHPALKVSVMNTLGQLVYVEHFSQVNTLNLNFPYDSGLYIVRMETPTDHYEIKVVKQ